MSKTNRIFVFVGVAVYAILFIVITLMVFIENDESQPISKIFQWDYLIPATVYSVSSLWVSFGLFLLLKKIFTHFFSSKVSKIISFSLSLIIGIPVGLILLGRTIRLLTA
jgi:hypothetical protein